MTSFHGKGFKELKIRGTSKCSKAYNEFVPELLKEFPAFSQADSPCSPLPPKRLSNYMCVYIYIFSQGERE